MTPWHVLGAVIIAIVSIFVGFYFGTAVGVANTVAAYDAALRVVEQCLRAGNYERAGKLIAKVRDVAGRPTE